MEINMILNHSKQIETNKDPIANIQVQLKYFGNFKGPRIIKGQVMVQNAITLGLNCNKLEHNRALVT